MEQLRSTHNPQICSPKPKGVSTDMTLRVENSAPHFMSRSACRHWNHRDKGGSPEQTSQPLIIGPQPFGARPTALFFAILGSNAWQKSLNEGFFFLGLWFKGDTVSDSAGRHCGRSVRWLRSHSAPAVWTAEKDGRLSSAPFSLRSLHLSL